MENNKAHLIKITNVSYQVSYDEEGITKTLKEKIKDYKLPIDVTEEDVLNSAINNEIDLIKITQGIKKIYTTIAGYEELVSMKYGITYYIKTPSIKSANPFEIVLAYKNSFNMITTHILPPELIDYLVVINKADCPKDVLGGIINADDETISFINKLMDLNVMSGNFNKSTKCYTNLSINNMGKLLKVYNVGTDLSTMYSIKITEGRTTIYTLMYSISNACFQSVSSVVLVPEIKTYLINHYDRKVGS